MNDYAAFLNGKTKRLAVGGIAGAEIHPMLFPFQRDLTRWALRKGRAAIFADTGLGKTFVQAEWARHVSQRGRVLILAPLAVAEQTVREAAKIGVEVRYARRAAEAADLPIVITNYELLHHFTPSDFAGVVIDECFPRGTIVDTPSGAEPIENLKPGDAVLGAAGETPILAIRKREISHAVKVTLGKREVVSSQNHPFFTARGWIAAAQLVPGDQVMETTTAMRLVRDGLLPAVSDLPNAALLRQILLSEVAHASAGDHREGSFSRGGGAARAQEGGVVRERLGCGREGTRADTAPEPDQRSSGQAEDIAAPSCNGMGATESRRQRQAAHGGGGSAEQSARTGMAPKLRRQSGAEATRIPDLLQDRHRESEIEDRDRGGWQFSPQSASAGCQEGCHAGFVRVDGVAILEPGDPRLERLRDAEGALHFYDLEVARHPSYSVQGLLVHNSSILKSFDGATRTAIIEAFRETPFRLACTATPAPNDFTELGNHSEFLGAKNRTEMLAEYFVHDGATTQEWRLKGHAEEVFWRWVCSWAVVVKRPSDLGYPNDGFDLPPLRMHERIVRVNHEDFHAEGLLFAPTALTLDAQRATRRATMMRRVELAAELASGDEPALVWCELNAEGDAAIAAIRGAVQVRGSDSVEDKVDRLLGFAQGRYRVLVTKPSIAAHGLNLQICAKEIFLGASHSFEGMHQAIRRCWRFGQVRPVDVYVIRAENEDAILANYRRKEADAERMSEATVGYMRDTMRAEISSAPSEWNDYNPQREATLPDWFTSGEDDARAQSV